MRGAKCLLIFLAITLSDGVKVNMKGSVSLGDAVVNALSEYMKGNVISGRRSMASVPNTVGIEIKNAHLCRDLTDICQGELRTFITDYVAALQTAVDFVLLGLLSEGSDGFLTQLHRILQDIRKIMRRANSKVSEDKEAYIWVDIIKKTSALYVKVALHFVSDSVDAGPKEREEVMNKLTPSIVTEIVTVEYAYEMKLCKSHAICSSHYCTKSLNTVLRLVKKWSDSKVKDFVRSFYESLPHATIIYKLNENTRSSFQTILNDMVHVVDNPAKEVLLSVQTKVEARLNGSNSNPEELGRDVILLNVILSDMDYLYDKQKKKDPFSDFIDNYIDWSSSGGRLNNHIRALMTKIEGHLTQQNEDLTLKLVSEVKLFLDITVGPEEKKFNY